MKRFWSLLLTVLLILSICLTPALAEESKLVIDLKTATDEELSDAAARIKAEQTNRLVTKIVLSSTELSLNKGKTDKLTAEVTDLLEGITAGKLEWTSSDEKIASCDANGKVKGTGAGQTAITCSCTLSDGTVISAVCAVTVTVPVQNIGVKQGTMTVMATDIFVPEVVVKPEDATNTAVTYTSDNENVVKVTEDGKLLATGAGKTNVTITAADGSGKTGKFTVNVTRCIGKYQEELTFQDLPWGSDLETAQKKLQDLNILAADHSLYAYTGQSFRCWPDNELKFALYNWMEIPVIFSDKGMGLAYSSTESLVKIGGYAPDYIYLYFLNSLTADGTAIDKEKLELTGIYVRFDNQHEPGSEIFTNLLTALEAQYGEFTRYISKDFSRRYYVDIYNGIKNVMSDAAQFGYRDLGKDNYLSTSAFCTLHGKNDTGIMLNVDSNGYVELFYGKLDTWQHILERQAILEAMPEDNAGSIGI